MDSSTMTPATEARLTNRRTIRARCTALVGLASDAVLCAKRRHHISRRLVRLDARSPGFAEATYPRIVAYFGALAALAFAYVVDLLLVGVIAEYFAQQLFPDSAALTIVARYTVPLALLGIENAIAVHLVDARHGVSNEGGAAVRAWWAFGILWACVIPIIVLGAQLVLGIAVEGSTSAGYQTLTYGLVALAFALHLFVLFGGELNQLAQGYLLYQVHRFLLVLRQWSLGRAWRRQTTNVRIRYAELCAIRDDYVAGFGEDLRLEVPKEVKRILLVDLERNDPDLATLQGGNSQQGDSRGVAISRGRAEPQ